MRSMDASSFFKGKKVTLMGLGLLGRGVGDAKFLAENGAELIVTDRKSKEELAPSLEALSSYTTIRYTLGEHRLEDFRGRDFVFYGPKTPLDSPFLAEARKQSAHTTMSTAFFAAHAGIPIVGVTGTRGKTTTTELIAHVLQKTGHSVLKGGNLRGISTLSLFPEVTKEAIAVLELDSWQLQGFRDERTSPHIAVFTNLMPDHLDYYPNMESYFADKANIFSFQKQGDALITGKAVYDSWIKNAQPPVTPRTPEPLEDDWKLLLLGRHNRDNAALAREALRSLSISDDEVRTHFSTFAPLEGRLQEVRVVNGIRIINDNNATTPTATAAALASVVGEGHRTILIVGGSDKNLPLTVLSDMIRELVSFTVLLPGTGTDRLLKKLDGISVARAESVAEALTLVMQNAMPGDVVLFSPGFASFGLFANEYDRNDRFVAAVQKL